MYKTIETSFQTIIMNLKVIHHYTRNPWADKGPRKSWIKVRVHVYMWRMLLWIKLTLVKAMNEWLSVPKVIHVST